MKTKVCVTILLFWMSICILNCNEHDEHRESIISEKPNELFFAKYYQSHDHNIKPNVLGYQLPLDENNIVNVSMINPVIDFNSISSHIRQNGFAIVEPEPFTLLDNLAYGDLVSIYKPLAWMNLLPFVTSDTMLYLYHTQFDETLKDIEEHQLASEINALTTALLNDALSHYGQTKGDLREAVKRNIAYLSVAQKLIDPDGSIPELVNDIVLNELAKIEAHEGFAKSDIFIYEEDYSQYLPRGHYTRSEQLERYFKTMMWCGRMTFLLKGSDNWGPTGEALVGERDARIQTLQAFSLVTSLKNIQVGARTGLDVWDRIYKVTSFYVGLADDLTPANYLFALNKIFETSFVWDDLTNENNLFKLKKILASLPAPKIYGGTGNIVLDKPITKESLNEVLEKTRGMRLMGQPFTPDSYVFQNLVLPKVGRYLGSRRKRPFTAGNDGSGGLYRTYVRGLDMMAVLGSNEAMNILTEEGDTNFQHYHLRFKGLKAHFDALSPSEWNVNL